MNWPPFPPERKLRDAPLEVGLEADRNGDSRDRS